MSTFSDPQRDDALLDALRIELKSRRSRPTRTIAESRAETEMWMASRPPPASVQVRRRIYGDIPGSCFLPPGNADYDILFLHGGSYLVGSDATHANLAGRLALAAGANVHAIRYRLAPEHPFPAALLDAASAYLELFIETGRSPVVCGDSAGGGLALSLLLRLHERGLEPPCMFLISPWVDLGCNGRSHSELADRDPWLTTLGLRRAATLYLGGRSVEDPEVSPLFGPPRKLPPLLIHVGSDEILLSDSLRLAEFAAMGGGSVSLEVWQGLFHVWHGFEELMQADEALGSAGNWLRAEASSG